MTLMSDIDLLIAKGKYKEAGHVLDNELAKKEDAQLYYLRAVVSYKLKNFNYAHEMLEHALYMKKELDYLKLKSLMLMETLDFQTALEVLKIATDLKKDAECYFLSAVCMMFLDDPKSRDYLQLAYMADKKRTKELIVELYNKFFKGNKFLSEGERDALWEKVGAVK